MLNFSFNTNFLFEVCWLDLIGIVELQVAR